MAACKARYEGIVRTHGAKHDHANSETGERDDEGDGGQAEQQEGLAEYLQDNSVEHGETEQRKD